MGGWFKVLLSIYLKTRSPRDVQYSLMMISRYSDLMRFLPATGARRGEVATMRWEHITGNVWTQSDPKQGVPHSLVLTPWIMALLPEKVSGHIWTSPRSPHVSPVSVTARSIKIRNRIGLPDKTIHDMRRTVGTRIAEMSGSAETADRVLGHALGGVTGRYVVTGLKDLKKEALEMWSDRLESLVRFGFEIPFP